LQRAHRSREEKIYRFTPRENDPVNGSWMCDTALELTNGSVVQIA